MRCSNCQTQNPDNHRHCSNCGAALTGCKHCGFDNSPEANFCGGCGRPVSANSVAESKPVVSAERRFTTILFCDLIGSTQLSTSLDPEDMRALIVDYHEMFRKVIEANDGFIAQYLGDGILAYFGYPTAHEDDAEQAVRAGLELIDTVAASEAQYEIRVGVASGMVVVGDLSGSNFFDREPAVGSTPNLAARLQGVAQAGWVVVSPTTRNLVRDQFEFEDLGPHDLKGFSEPVPLSRALSEQTGINRFEASRANRQLSSLAGRERELDQLMQCWDRAKSGSGQVVCLRADPGLGKSRLMLTLTASLENETFTALRYQCGPHFTNTALYPIISQIERSAGFRRGDTDEVKLDKLESLLAQSGSDDFAGTVRYIAALISILFGDRYAPIEESAERQRERTLNTLVAQIEALAAVQPVMLLFEDTHWIDPTTLELLTKIVDATTNLPVLLLATCRPEFTPPWQNAPSATTIELKPLADADSTRIIEDIVTQSVLPDAIKQGILKRGEGNPLFLEELTRAVIESGSDSNQIQRPEVPESLRTSLNERLDRDRSNKHVAQAAAVLGRDFTVDLLAAATQKRSTELGLVLERLIDANIIERTMDLMEPVYRFKHALLQDAAYESMLLIERANIHRRVAAALESGFPEIVENQPETIARHLTEAGENQRAIGYWQQAGERAAERAAHRDAADHFFKAISLLEDLPETIERHQLELALRGQYGFSYSASHGYAAPEVEKNQLRALELCELIGDPETVYAVKRRLCTFFIVRSEFGKAAELARQCVELGELRQRTDYLIEGYNALGYVLAYQAEFHDAMAALEKSAHLYRTQGGANFVYPTEQHPLLAVLTMMALVSSIRGQAQQAIKYIQEAIEIAKRLNNPFDLSYAENFFSQIEHIQGLPEDGQEHGRIGADIAEEHGFDLWACLNNFYAAFSNKDNRDIERRIELMNQNMAIQAFTGARLFLSFLYGSLAKSYLLAENHHEASAILQRAFQHAEQFNEKIYEPGLHRINGELQAAMGLVANACESFEIAATSARDMGAGVLELQALVSLFKLEQQQGITQTETKQKLAQVVEAFSSRGEHIPIMDEARTLLAGAAEKPASGAS